MTGIENGLPLFSGVGDSHECTPSLPLPHVAEKLEADYALTGLTLGPHPLKLLREALRQRRCHSARELEVAFPMDILSVPLAGCVCDNGHQLPAASLSPWKMNTAWSMWWSGANWPNASK